jgi:hypothetical protein
MAVVATNLICFPVVLAVGTVHDGEWDRKPMDTTPSLVEETPTPEV